MAPWDTRAVSVPSAVSSADTLVASTAFSFLTGFKAKCALCAFSFGHRVGKVGNTVFSVVGTAVVSVGAVVASVGAVVASVGAAVVSVGAAVVSVGAVVTSVGAVVASVGAVVASVVAVVASVGVVGRDPGFVAPQMQGVFPSSDHACDPRSSPSYPHLAHLQVLRCSSPVFTHFP